MTGKFYEDLDIGAHYRHSTGRTVSEADNVLFSALTMNPQALHLNADYAEKTQFGQRIVNGIFTFGLVVGLSVADLTDGTIVANLSYEKVNHPKPVFHGDTIYAETDVLDKRESRSNPATGIIRLKQIGRNQQGEIVIELERSVLFLKRPADAAL